MAEGEVGEEGEEEVETAIDSAINEEYLYLDLKAFHGARSFALQKAWALSFERLDFKCAAKDKRRGIGAHRNCLLISISSEGSAKLVQRQPCDQPRSSTTAGRDRSR